MPTDCWLPVLKASSFSPATKVSGMKAGEGVCLDAVDPIPDADASGEVLELRCHHLKLMSHLRIGVQIGGRVWDLELACRRAGARVTNQ